MKKLVVLFLLITAVLGCGHVRDRGAKPAQTRSASLEVRTQDGEQVARFGEAYALVIGESSYNNGWNRLPGVKRDVAAVKQLFEEMGFHVETIQDANSDDLDRSIRNFLNKYGYIKDARLILYYAGHGETLTLSTNSEMGYIVPIDAPLPSRDERGFKQKAIAMDQFKTWAKTYDSRHILFIFDSCFSGTVFRSAGKATPPAISRQIAQPVRQFITAGTANEEVPDESVFRKQLESGLRFGLADANNDGYVSGTELGLFLYDTVSNYMKGRQNPQQGKLNDPDLDKGDFIFAVGMQAARREETKPDGPNTSTAVGSVTVTSEIAGVVMIDNEATRTRIKAGGTVTIANVSTGATAVAVKEDNGNIVEAAQKVMVRQGQAVSTMIERPPVATIVVYAASPGQMAFESLNSRNGLFTQYLLKHIATSDLSAVEMFSRVLADVNVASKTQQNPVIYNNGSFPAIALTKINQKKYALVIGNQNYASAYLKNLAAARNDANDMEATLKSMGFTVDKVLDGNLIQMENALVRMRNNLKTTKDSYGFFYYAGHGVALDGVNYLIPTDADISSENNLRIRALPLDVVLSEMESAKNTGNIVVLDANGPSPLGGTR
jgi:uncharacterized caspase-like protein